MSFVTCREQESGIIEGRVILFHQLESSCVHLLYCTVLYMYSPFVLIDREEVIRFVGYYVDY